MQESLNKLIQLKNRWSRLLSYPDWYLAVIPEMRLWLRNLESETEQIQETGKEALYEFFEDRLRKGEIALGVGQRFDAGRQAVDTVVVHHTSNSSGMTPERLSAIELIRLYAPYFEKPTSPDDNDLRGEPIFSGHVRNGRQVFWPYHWIVRTNGTFERLLNDSEVGWHAGNWNINCRGVAIVLDNDYEFGRPSDAELAAIVRIVRHYYPFVKTESIVGHQEITAKTICPSRTFLDHEGARGWKSDLLALLLKRAA